MPQSDFARIIAVHPRLFFKSTPQGLAQLVDIDVDNPKTKANGTVTISFGSVRTHRMLHDVIPGKSTYSIELPEIETDEKVHFDLTLDGKLQESYDMAWPESARWEIHMVPNLAVNDALLGEPDFSRLIQYCDETAGFPKAAQLTFTIPAVKPLKSWLSRTSRHKAEKFMKLVQAGRIEVAAFFNQPTMDLLNDEGLIRQMYAAEALRVQHQIPVTTAIIDLEQGFTWGLADILPAAGINICFSNGNSDQPAGVYHRQGQAGRKLMCWQDSVAVTDFKFEADTIETHIKQLQQADYPFPAFRFQLNSAPGPESLALCKAVQKWNQEWAFPKLMLSTNSRFWAAIESYVPENTPVLTGDAGSLTSSVAATAAALELSVARRAQAELKIAEKTAALASIFSSKPYPGLTLNSAYEEVLHFFEPPTTSTVPVGTLFDAGQADKRHAAFSALGKAEAVTADALKKLVANVPLENDGCHLVVFNPSERPRTDIVQADFISAVAPDHRLPAELVEQGFVLTDAASGDKILYQIDEVSNTSEAALQSSKRFALGQIESAYLKTLVFVARDVPAMGFKVFALQPVDATEIRPKKVDMAVKTLENDFYRISVSANGGGVFSILDKELETDIMDGFAKNRLNQLFVRDGGRDSIHKLENVSLRREQRGAVSVSLIITGQAQGCPQVVQEITLFNDIKRIDFTNRILKDATPLQEVYFSFPFQVRDAKIQYPHGINILEPATGQIDGKLPAAQAIGDWVSITNETMGIAWSSPDAPIVRFSELSGDPAAAEKQLHSSGKVERELKNSHLYSLVMTGNYQNSAPNVQVSDSVFRYSLTSFKTAGESNSNGSEGGLHLSCPLQSMFVSEKQNGIIPIDTNFIELEPDHVRLQIFKKTEKGKNWLLRLVETAGKPASIRLKFNVVDLEEAEEVTIVEADGEKLAVSEGNTVCLECLPYELKSIRLKFSQPE